MFILPEATKRSQAVSARAKTALYYLASLCGQTNECFAYMETISQGISRGIRTAQRAVAELIDQGLVERELRHYHRCPTYRLVCLEERLSRQARRARERQEAKPSKEVMHSHPPRGDNPDGGPLVVPFPSEQTTLYNDHYTAVRTTSSTGGAHQQPSQTQNNGCSQRPLEKPKRMHPSEARLLAEDIAELLGFDSLQYWLKIAWRASEQAIYEALSFVRGEMLEGHSTNPAGLFVHRLRVFHNLRI
jgi:hypothetical protein